MQYFKHKTAIVDDGAKIGQGTKVWHFVHVSAGAKIGEKVVLGQNCYVGGKAEVGNGVKVQNNVSIYDNVIIEDDVFCGPSMVFTNVNTPRAFIERKDEYATTRVRKGVSLGANCTVICGVEIGEYAFIGAGAVVTKNVKPYALMAGVPAKQIGWVSWAGEVLGDDLTCPRDGSSYEVDMSGYLQKTS